MFKFKQNECPVCLSGAHVYLEDYERRAKTICPKCGRFTITNLVFEFTQIATLKNGRDILSYWIRKNHNDDKDIFLDWQKVKEIIENIKLPDLKEQINNFILWVGDNSDPGKDVMEDMRIIASIIGANGREGVFYFVNDLNKKGIIKTFLDTSNDFQGQLTPDGWELYDTLKKVENEFEFKEDSKNNNQVLVTFPHHGLYNNIDIIKEILDQGENDTRELKASFCLAVKRYLLGDGMVFLDNDLALDGILKTIVAFLNSKGGSILIGIIEKSHFQNIIPSKQKELSDSGDYYLFGIEKEIENLNKDKYELKIRGMIEEHIAKDCVELIQIKFHEYLEKIFCLITVSKRKNKWYYLDGKFIVRNGNRSVELKGEDADIYKQRNPIN